MTRPYGISLVWPSHGQIPWLAARVTWLEDQGLDVGTSYTEPEPSIVFYTTGKTVVFCFPDEAMAVMFKMAWA